ncbi:MAG: hypothetical protein ACYCY2_02320 [Acidithiobacillus ferriphilus]
MTSFSASPLEKSRKAHSRVLQALGQPGKQGAIASVLGTSDSTISRLKNERLEDVLALLYAAGFKLVAADKVCIDPEALEFMRATTARALSHSETAARLWEEDE